MTNFDYLYSPAAAKVDFAKNRFLDKKLDFQIIKNGTMLPHRDVYVDGKWTWGKGGIVDSNGKFVKGSHVISGIAETYLPPPESIQYRSETVIYLGLFFHVWGHVITDNIRRIWFLKSEIFRGEFKNCPLVYIPWENCPLERQKNFSRLLEILEVDLDKIQPINQPTKFEKIILPDESFFIDDAKKFNGEYRETIERIRNFAIKNRTPTSNEKIFYFHGNIQVGEERLAEYFKSKGYAIVQPEKLTFDEQLNILINAESFASTLGSCSHNSVFLRDNTETVIIPREALFGRDYQYLLDQVHPVNANYVDSTLSIFDKGNRYHCYTISEQLKNFFGDKWEGYAEDDFKIFLQYVKISVANGFDMDLREKEYYEPVFSGFIAQLKRCEDLLNAYGIKI